MMESYGGFVKLTKGKQDKYEKAVGTEVAKRFEMQANMTPVILLYDGLLKIIKRMEKDGHSDKHIVLQLKELFKVNKRLLEEGI